MLMYYLKWGILYTESLSTRQRTQRPPQKISTNVIYHVLCTVKNSGGVMRSAG